MERSELLEYKALFISILEIEFSTFNSVIELLDELDKLDVEIIFEIDIEDYQEELVILANYVRKNHIKKFGRV